MNNGSTDDVEVKGLTRIDKSTDNYDLPLKFL